MSDDPKNTLQKAYELIEAGSLDDARELLDGYLQENPNDADGWWLYANAVDDPEEGTKALRRVLSIDPNYSDAREILDELEESGAIETESDELSFVATTSESPDFLSEVDEDEDDTIEDEDILPFEQPETVAVGTEPVDDMALSDDEFDLDDEFDFGDEDEFDLDEEEEEAKSGFSLTRVLIGILALIIILVIVFVVFVILPGRTPDDQQVAQSETPVATADAGSTTVTVDDAVASQFYSALANLDVIEGSATVEQTSEGSTFSVSICSVALDSTIRNNVDLALRIMADESDALSDLDAIGIRLLNCEGNNDVIRYIVTPIDRATAFTNQEISLTEFSASWEAQTIND